MARQQMLGHNGCLLRGGVEVIRTLASVLDSGSAAKAELCLNLPLPRSHVRRVIRLIPFAIKNPDDGTVHFTS